MALLHVHFTSEVLGFGSSMDVILPEKPCPYPDGKWPTIYLLHGYGGNHTNWQRRSAIELYLHDKNLAAVMPSVHNGFYTDMAHGPAYWTYVSCELPAICERMFPLSQRREDRFAAGLSMGGYGAMKLGLRCPDRYAAVASLSGVVDVVHAEQGADPTMMRHLEDVFGSLEALRDSEDDVPAVARRLIASGAEKPHIYMACGTEDFLYGNNQQFLAEFAGPLSITYEEGPGVHDWYFWDAYIQRVLAWLPIKQIP